MQAQSTTRYGDFHDIPYCPWPYDDKAMVFLIRRHGCGSRQFKFRPTDGVPICAKCFPYFPRSEPVAALSMTRTDRASVELSRENGRKGIWGRKERKGSI